jgi:DNA mismatch repair protein MutL
MESPRPVALLPPEVSRRIAAGEVIERPASVVRELLDNSLDAAAGSIDVSWEGGGVELIRVHDDGRGMTAEDLELCWHPHATSKIRSIEDLDTSRTLGFRGEALASVAAVSDLEIRTYRSGDTTGTALRVRHAEAPETGPAPPVPGTIVEVRQLFANLPARRRFLSRAQAESQAIRNVVLDKALPFPSIRFSHSTGSGETRVLPVHSLIERVGAVFGSPVPVESLHHVSGSGEGFSLTVVAAEPAIVRRDRRLIRIFVNNRRVQEYALVQAVEYAYRDVQHGGLFPAAAVLVDIDPALVDFNIHPAKREVRLRTGSEIHHRLVEILRSFLRTWTVRAVTLGRNSGHERPPKHGRIFRAPSACRVDPALPIHHAPAEHGRPAQLAPTRRPEKTGAPEAVPCVGRRPGQRRISTTQPGRFPGGRNSSTGERSSGRFSWWSGETRRGSSTNTPHTSDSSTTGSPQLALPRSS